MNQAMLNTILLMLFGTVLGVITTWFWKSREAVVAKAAALALENKKTLDRVSELEKQLALVNQAVIPISTAFQAILVKELTHYHTPEMDALMEKIGPPNLLTADEEKRLSVLLEERTRDMGPEITESERDAAAILPMVIKRAHAEAETLMTAEALKIRLVTVAAVLGLPNVRTDDEQAVGQVLDAAHERRKKPEEHTDVPPVVFVPTVAAKDKELTASVAASTEQSLKNIDANTAATAESLSILNKRATEKLVDTAVKKALDAEKAE